MIANAVSRYPLSGRALLFAASMYSMYSLILLSFGETMSGHFIASCFVGGAVLSLIAFFHRYLVVILLVYASVLYFSGQSSEVSAEFAQLAKVMTPTLVVAAAGVLWYQLTFCGIPYFFSFERPSLTDAITLLAVAGVPWLVFFSL
jgi:hypothetical protein